MNPLQRLREHGQSFWLDNLTRGMVQHGELERRLREEGLSGVTSNPAIFQKAISEGDEYDEEIERFALEGRSAAEIYDRLTVSDVRAACDVLRLVFDRASGADGFVSLEVSPHLAHRTDETLVEARRLFQAVARPNVLIKIPGTPAGVPAVEEALFQGINVNITLLFSIHAYEAVADAYLQALERRLAAGLRVDDVASVASFFLSRIDSSTDRRLQAVLDSPERTSDAARAERMLGKTAIVNAKLAYQSLLTTLDGDRWRGLAAHGARPQRLLWASTSTKNPSYSDVKYVEPLIGPRTINTMPEVTIRAFLDHGRVDRTIDTGVEEAREAMAELSRLGIDFEDVADELLDEGIRKFIAPYDALLATLEEERTAILVRGGSASGAETGAVAADG